MQYSKPINIVLPLSKYKYQYKQKALNRCKIFKNLATNKTMKMFYQQGTNKIIIQTASYQQPSRVS